MQMLRIVAVLVWVVASPIFTPVTTDSVWASGQQRSTSYRRQVSTYASRRCRPAL